MTDDAKTVNATNSSAELPALLNAAVDGIIVADPLGRIRGFNKAAERIFGYEAHEVLGRSVKILMTDEDRDSQHRLQERLMHVSRLATVGEMASGIAHELNQPLAAIATYAHACDRLLAAAQPDIEEVQGALQQIAAQAVRAGDIIRKLRGLAKHEQINRVQSDVNAVVSELNEVIEADARSHGVEYRRDLQLNLPQVVLDRSQIQQVVMNLVHNALDSLALAQIDAKELVVRTRTSPSGDVEISVCDNGVGVMNSVATRMFDPFCSTKPTGTGLGLPISQTIVRAHDGVLEYTPNEPRGACFTVRFPATEAVPA